jgi:hypothetical protein
VERPAGYFAAEEDGGGGVHMISIVGVNIERVFSFVASEEGTPQLLQRHLICTCNSPPDDRSFELNLKDIEEEEELQSPKQCVYTLPKSTLFCRA